MLMYHWMVQVHWSVINGVMGVQWSWKSAVKDTMGATSAPSGSMMDFDTYCNFGFVLEPFPLLFIVSCNLLAQAL